MEAELNQRLEDVSREKDSLLIDKDAGMRRTEEMEKSLDDIKAVADQLKNENITLGLELENARGELSNMQQLLESANLRVADLSNTVKANEVEMKSLTLKIAELLNEKEQSQNEIQELRTESSQLMERLGERDREVLELEKISRDRESKIDGLTAQLNSLLVDVDSLHTQKQEVEELMLSKTDEASALLKSSADQVHVLEQELESIRNQKAEMELQLERRTNEAKQLGEENEELRLQVSELEKISENRRDELFSLGKKLEDSDHELKLVQSQKAETVLQLKTEAQRLRDENAELQAQVSELENISENKRNELLVLGKKLEDNEHESEYRIEDLKVQLNNLRVEIESSQVQKRELEDHLLITSDEASTQAKVLTDQANILQHELELLKSREAELGLQLERKTTEAQQLVDEKAELQGQVSELEKIAENRREELSALTKKLEDQEHESESRIVDLTAQVSNLLMETESSHAKKRELEDHILSKTDEAAAQVNALQQELELLQSQNVEMGLQLERKSQEISDHLAQTENFREEILKNTQVQKAILEEKESLAAQVNDLESKVDFLSIQKSKLEEHVNNKNNEINQLIDKSLEMERSLSELEDEFFALQKKSENAENEVSAEITDLTMQVENLHEELNSLHVKNKQLELQLEREKQEYTQVEDRFQECKSNLESKDETVAELEETVEELKRELEVKVDELTDQLLTEKEESFRLGEAKFLQEQKLLEERIATLSRLITASNKAHHEIITNISETVNSTLLELETVIQNFKDQCGNYEKHILDMAEELKTAKNWVSETNCKKKLLEEEVGSLVEQLKITKEREMDLKGKAEKLEAKAREELARAVKEKEDGLVDIGEEKREAIRQLCEWIEYHRDRYEDLRKTVASRMTARLQRTN